MLETERLQLIPGTEAHFQGELAGREAFAQAIGVVVPAGWPPEFYDGDAVRYTLAWLHEHPDQTAWSFYYVVRKPAGGVGAVLIGACGFKGPPDPAGVVELGYGIVAEYQRQGFATEAVRGLVRFAFASPAVTTVIGQTLPHLRPSIGVLEKAGFRFAGAGDDPHAPPGEQVVRYELLRAEDAHDPLLGSTLK